METVARENYVTTTMHEENPNDDNLRSQIVSEAIIDGCQLGPSGVAVQAINFCARATHCKLAGDDLAESVPAVNGSAAEFYIQPMMPNIADFDIMYYFNTELVIPAAYPTPTTLPEELGREVTVYEIHDTSIPCYVFLRRKYRLSRDLDNNIRISHTYSDLEYMSNRVYEHLDTCVQHGPATADFHVWTLVTNMQCELPVPQTIDTVRCLHCPVWPPQSFQWPHRKRHHGWPDSATIDRVVNQGCDFVPVSHRLYRDDEYQCRYQWRHGFAGAEAILLNSWTPIQQIVYHLLRFNIKTERFTADDSPVSNYHIKTLMLWSCELRPENWWTDSNLIQLCCELLHELARSLNNEMCQHYFVVDCNLFDFVTSRDPVVQSIITSLQSCTQTTLTTWFIEHYLQPCARRYSDDVGRMFDYVITTSQLRRAVSCTLRWRDCHAAQMAFLSLNTSALEIFDTVNRFPLTAGMCKYYQSALSRTDRRLLGVFAAAVLMKCYTEIEVSGCICRITLDALTNVVDAIGTLQHCVSLLNTIARDCNTSFPDGHVVELSQFLLTSAVERFTSFHQLVAQEFSGDERIAIGTTDFEALYAYRCRQYDECLTLSQQIVDRTFKMPIIPRMYIRGMMSVLMDDAIRSVLGLMELCDIKTFSGTSSVGQDVLALYLILKCKLKLNHSTESLIETLRQVNLSYSRYNSRSDPLSRCILQFAYRQTFLLTKC